MSIPFYYDPMIAKLVCHAETREMAIEKTLRALTDYEITGVETTIGFCRFAVNHGAFRSGNFDTNFVNRYFKPEFLQSNINVEEESVAVALAGILLEEKSNTKEKVPTMNNQQRPTSSWKQNRLHGRD
jgi:acetyl-CoA carboxylase, biotin carboxylase subunit